MRYIQILETATQWAENNEAVNLLVSANLYSDANVLFKNYLNKFYGISTMSDEDMEDLLGKMLDAVIKSSLNKIAEEKMNLQEAIDIIENIHGFDDETSSVGEAWTVVLSHIKSKK